MELSDYYLIVPSNDIRKGAGIMELSDYYLDILKKFEAYPTIETHQFNHKIEINPSQNTWLGSFRLYCDKCGFTLTIFRVDHDTYWCATPVSCRQMMLKNALE